MRNKLQGIKLRRNNYQEFVVVEDRVEVLDPLGVNVAVENDPLPLVDLASHVVDDPSEDVREEAVAPLARVRVQDSVERLLRHGLGVDDMSNSFDAFVKLQGLQQDSPGGRLAGARRAHHHET